MRFLIRLTLIGLIALSGSGGINWKTIWLEPNPVLLEPGSSLPYVVKGIHGGDGKADLTDNPHLTISSSDSSVVEVDRKEARLIGRSAGRAVIRISFSQCTSVVQAVVKT